MTQHTPPIKAVTMRGGLDKPTTQQLQARIAELEQQHDELLAAFIEYGTHPETCRKQSRNPDKCDCGYRQTINKHKAQGVV